MKSGQIRVLAYFTRNRIPSYPGVPAAPELGLGVLPPFPMGIVGPKGMAPAAVKRLHDALKDALDTPVMEKAMFEAGTPKTYMSSSEFSAFIPQALASHGDTLARIGLAKHKPLRRG